MPTIHPILSLNSGSSSLKFALYELGNGREVRLVQGAAERIGLPGGRLWLRGPEKNLLLDEQGHFQDHGEVMESFFTAAPRLQLPRPAAIGHRLVHGGPDLTEPKRVTPELIEKLKTLIPFAPLHLPSEIHIIELCRHRLPEVHQVACFDTAFHRGMPEIAQRLPLPRILWDEGVRRYGFHGLSYEYIVNKLGPKAQGRTIIAHLGNGASLAAVDQGQPVDTTMGMTPTGGLLMGTRSGDLDPGVLIYIMNEKGYDASELERLVDQQAGLLGVSGFSSDMKVLLDSGRGEAHAAQAVEMFCYHVRKHIGALTAALGGLDALVFTGGIGERAAPVRERICRGLEYLGIHLDVQRNEVHADTISSSGSRCTVRVIPTNEDLMIARQTRSVVFAEEG